MKELLELIAARRRAPQTAHAVATVLRVEGSSYRRPGARMLINLHGRAAGSISGGCLERAVITAARRTLLDGLPRLLAYDTSDQDDLALGTSLGCQGKIWIGLELLPAHAPWNLEAIAMEVRTRREARILVSKIHEGGSEPRFETSAFLEDELETILPDLANGGNRKTNPNSSAHGLLVERLDPPLSLWLFGAGPDVTPMIHFAGVLGHEVTVIDRRPEFALAENFSGALRVIAAKPNQLREGLQPDQRTAAVLMNHHYDTDRDMLAALISFNLPYIAMLGPKRRTQRILEELAAEGHDIEAVSEALHGPAGLDIGSNTPEEIALSILAELQATLAQRQGGKLRQRAMPIHGEVSATRPCSIPA